MGIKAEKVYVILSNFGSSSCAVNAVCLNKEYAKKWVAKENKELGFKAYWVEQSQLIK